jgi:alkane 1-monooxygenase
MSAVYHAVDPQTGPVEYRDHRRWLWLGSVVNPLVPFVGIGLHAATGVEWLLLTPLLIAYGVGPLLDWWLGEDRNNPPEAVVPQLEEDRYYRVLTWLTVPLHFVTLIGCAWWAGTQPLSWWGFLGLAYIAGITAGLGINTAHELGHKRGRLEQWLARIALAVPAYGHFCVEHNRGHHRDVATPEDPASSRMGEDIYRFALREIPGAMRRGWALERERLQREGRSAWSPHNEILQSHAIAAVLQLGLVAAFGWKMLPFLAAHNVIAWFQLTSANYVEHYGLLRRRLPSGKYERPQPHHSWNANHTYTNLILFQLERHSDHHAYPLRRYQSLRHFDDVPQLPSGYQGMFPIAYLPPLWFRVMDPRLLALPQVAGDLDRVNVDPRKREALYRRYGQEHKLQAPVEHAVRQA